MEKALKEAEKYDVSLAEVRVFSVMDENLAVRNGQIEQAGKGFNQGINISIINKDGARGFAMSANYDNIPNLVETAYKVSNASAKKMRKKIELTNEPVIVDEYRTEFKKNPFDVDINDKLELLKLSDSILREDALVKVAQSRFEARKVKLHFANSEGTKILQEQIYTGTAVEATASKMDTHTREHHGYEMRGFEFVEDFNYEESAKRIATEVLSLVNDAENAEKGKATLVLDPYMLGLTIHESTGHPTELDRAMGFEADFAGTSFLTTDLLDREFKYGSELVNLVCDPTIPGNLGHYKYDDEGVAAKKFNIIENGIFKNYMTDRETAKDIGMDHSWGNSRMSLYDRIPIVRMSHLYLEPDKSGPKGFEDFIAEIPDGIYASGWKSHSIDDKRMNFQFSTQIAWKIENGELSKPIKNFTYNDATPRFWGSLDMVGSTMHIDGHGPVCGKGVPMQAIWISHGGGYARFNEVNVFAG